MTLDLKLSFHKKSILPNNGRSESTDETLVVILHGIGSGYKKLDGLIDMISANGNSHVWAPTLAYAGLWGYISTTSPETIVREIQNDLDRIWAQGNYKYIKIIGHSMGGLIARAVVIQGIEQGCEWAKTFQSDRSRVVLLAAVNKGLGITLQLSFFKMIGLAFGAAIARMLQFFFPIRFTLLNAMRGSEFVIKHRIRWIKAEHAHKVAPGKYPIPIPNVIQLLGSIDDVVGPSDSLDLVTGKKFRYLDVKKTNHAGILQVSPTGAGSAQKQAIQDERWRVIQLALEGEDDEIREEEVRPWELDRSESQIIDSAANEVVFVIHGIRDNGYWTDKIARRIWRIADARLKAEQMDRNGAISDFRDTGLRKVVDSYGFLGMGPFIFPSNRRKKVEWFMERYLEAKAKYPPETRFHFVGHSHGTYVLAKALETYEDCKFDNVVFAGSVVRTDFQWTELLKNEQVKRVLNFQATNDWVVAIFPRFFDFFNFQDLGGAGHNGFTETDDVNNQIFSVRYAIGAHGAGKEEELWDDIGRFILSDPSEKHLPDNLVEANGDYANPNLKAEKNRFFFEGLVSILSYCSPILLFFIIWFLIIVVPILIIKYAGPLVAGLFARLSSYEWLSLELIIPLILAISFPYFIVRQSKYKRKFGALRTLIGLIIVGWVLFYSRQVFHEYLGDDSLFSGDYAPNVIITSTILLMLWVLFARFVLRKL